MSLVSALTAMLFVLIVTTVVERIRSMTLATRLKASTDRLTAVGLQVASLIAAHAESEAAMASAIDALDATTSSLAALLPAAATTTPAAAEPTTAGTDPVAAAEPIAATIEPEVAVPTDEPLSQIHAAEAANGLPESATFIGA